MSRRLRRGVTVGTQAWIQFRCGGGTGRRLLAVKNDSTSNILMKNDDSTASHFNGLGSKSRQMIWFYQTSTGANGTKV